MRDYSIEKAFKKEVNLKTQTIASKKVYTRKTKYKNKEINDVYSNN